MIWLLLILIILITVLTYLLFAPFFLEIDSTKGMFKIRFHHLISVRILLENSSLILEIKSPMWNKRINLLAQNERRKTFPKKKVLEKKKDGKSFKIKFSKIKAMIRTFKVNTFFVNLDTNDVLLNAKLFPVFLGLRIYTRKELYINFIGKNEIKIEIENNMARIIWAFIFNKQ